MDVELLLNWGEHHATQQINRSIVLAPAALICVSKV